MLNLVCRQQKNNLYSLVFTKKNKERLANNIKNIL